MDSTSVEVAIGPDGHLRLLQFNGEPFAHHFHRDVPRRMHGNPFPRGGPYIGSVGALLTVVGTLLSGPLSVLLVSSVHPQPAWSGPEAYVQSYHPVQSLTFYFGLLLVAGSVLIIASIYLLADQKGRPLLALIFTSLASGLISLNYVIQLAFLPAIVRDYTPELDPLITMFSVVNPTSSFWALEMWGYGFLGIGTWLAASFFTGRGLEQVAKVLFVLNGVLSIAGALLTSWDLEWVLSTAGVVSYVGWNLLYLILGGVFFVVLRRRRSTGRGARG